MPSIFRDEQGVSDVVVGLVDEFSRPYGVRQTANQPQVMIGDAAGALVDTPTGESGNIALAVHEEHLHQTMWNHYFKQDTGVTTTLNGAIAINTKVLEFTDASGFIVGNKVDINIGAVHIHMYRCIVSIATNIVTLDAPVDIDVPDGSTINQTSFNMAVNGAVTPQIFKVVSTPGEKIDIMRLLFSIVDGTAPDDSKFGGAVALTNGVHLRKNNNEVSYKTLSVWKANKDMKEDMYNVTYTDKSGGGNHGVNGRWTIFETGAVINIDGDNNESVECIIQDDLTVLVDFQMKAQGHIEI